MRLRMLVAVWVIALMCCQAQGFSYDPPVGIPNPKDFFDGFDPIESVCPDEPDNWNQDIEHWYYVNNQADNASDAGNGNRVVPRRTIPTDLNPGDVVIIEGGPYHERYAFDNIRGTAANPVWIRGVDSNNKPVIMIQDDTDGKPDWDFSNCSYLILENLEFNGSDRKPSTENVFAGAIYVNENSDHLVFRHIAVKDYPQPAACNLGRAAISVQFSSSWSSGEVNQYHVFYDVRIENYQTNWPPPCEDGSQGIVLIDGVDHIWILDSYFYHLAEDGIHIIGLHGRHDVDEKRGPHDGLPNYIYIGSNEFYSLGENAVDVKESNHVIISHNKMHHFRHTRDYGWPAGYGAAGNAIAINDEGSQNAGGDESASNVWIIFNEIYDAVIGAFVQSGNPTFFIGNIIYDLVESSYTTSSGIWISKVNSTLPSAKVYIVNNTLYDIPYGVLITNTFDHFSANNIVSEISSSDGYHYRCINVRGVNSMKNEVFYDSENVRLSLNSCENCIEQDPLFVNAQTHDFRLNSHSPCVDNGVSSLVYDIFKNYYNINIRKDINNVVRPQNDVWDIGAYEYVGTGNYADEDVNQDGSVTVNDVQIVVNVILGTTTNSRADVNGSGTTDVQDVQAVVNEVIG